MVNGLRDIFAVALGEGAGRDGGGVSALHGDGLHRGGVGEGDGLGVLGAFGRRRGAVNGVVDGGACSAAAHRHLGALLKRSAARDDRSRYSWGL